MPLAETETRDADYSSRVASEREHFRKVLGESADGLVPAPPVWTEVEGIVARKIARVTGAADGVQFVISLLDQCRQPRILSLGSGTCSLELQWILPMLRDPASCSLECVDLNEELVEQGRAAAAARGFRFQGHVQDINRLSLEPCSYDVVFCWAALHHFVELDHVAAEVNQALKPDGTLVAMDVCSRNGFVLWPETRIVVDRLWQLLPPTHRLAHTLGPEPLHCERYPEVDCSASGFECLRSEDVLPALERNLRRQHLIFAHCLLRRFFDTMFGPNFDLRRPFDRAFFEVVRDLDELHLEAHTLRPETFFGVYRRRSAPAVVAPTLAEVFGETAG
jgi:SAM-dependent methyltransferase